MYLIYWLIDQESPRTYLGLTDNLTKRIKDHKFGKTKTTKSIKHFKYCIIEKDIVSLDLARQREKYWKSAAGRKRLKILYQRLMVPSSNG